MKLKSLLVGALICSFSFAGPLYAGGSHYRLPKLPKYSASYGRIHQVRPYFKKNGTFIQGHRSGNPRSDIHCHNNVCY